MHWQNLYDRDCTGNSSVEFKQVKAKLLTDLESAEEQSHYITIDEVEILMDIADDEEYLGGEDFEMIEAGQQGEDTDWMEVAPIELKKVVVSFLISKVSDREKHVILVHCYQS